MEHVGVGGSSSNFDALSDDELMLKYIGGNEIALRTLMDRYDRLVRYTVFQRARAICVRDRDWLEAVASDAWMSFSRTLISNPFQRPKSVSSVLFTVATRRTISALRERGTVPTGGTSSIHFDELSGAVHSAPDDPSDTISRLELLESLRAALKGVEPDETRMLGLLGLIMERKWGEAGAELGWPESTLRSRWSALLEKIRRRLRKETGDSVAPRAETSDLS
ncbi:MAG: hypothetical protein HY287_13750 [Planctomycetes bacterium]|nr:hypothetical protein [Planctomycetota bacterium]